jgi:2-oxoglutarate ferredoxin oxidoreductase subunit gamma
MTEEIIIAGFGGQGVLSMGKILAYSGIMQDQEVSWMPSYGPEMRGGTANVTVILSDERISSPYLKIVDTAIILNQQSMDKFEESVKPNGVLIYDPNGITAHPTRTDIKIFQIEGTKLASEMGNKKIFNMIILGGYLKVKPVVKLENVIEGLKKSISERYHNLIPLNVEAITMGMNNIVPYKVETALFQHLVSVEKPVLTERTFAG